MSDLDEKLEPVEHLPGSRARRQMRTLVNARGAKIMTKNRIELTVMETTTVWVREAPGSGGMDSWFVQES